MAWHRQCAYATEIALSAAAVIRRIAIKDFSPEPSPIDADPVVAPNFWRKIADYRHRLSRASLSENRAKSTRVRERLGLAQMLGSIYS